MSLNQNVQNPSKENFINGYINDFTDCIDFTKQYQKSCGFEEENSEAVHDAQIEEVEKKDSTIDKFTDFEEKQSKILKKCDPKNEFLSSTETCVPPNESTKNGEINDIETNYHPMEPDVSITVDESNLEKTIDHVASGTDVKTKNNEKSLDLSLSKNCKKKINKKLVKKNHLKLPLNKSIKKKVALFKYKKVKSVKKRSESLQYQDIQSNIKFKCYKCSYSDLSTFSELQSHQRKCITGATDFQANKEPSSFTNSSPSNFRITRKVYLCSACGSYYENWNLFLHMKEMHKRHICLYCLGMFSQPDKLAQHLQAKHNVIEQTLSSIEEFLKLYRGTCYLICVSCEAMFLEQEDFFKHSCISQSDDLQFCPLCGLHGAHFPTCRRAFSDHYLEPDSQKSHPALGKKLNIRKKKVKNNKKTKEMFHIVNNDNNGEMSVIVRKQNKNDIPETINDFKGKNNFQGQKDIIDNSVMTALRNSNEDLVSSKQYNEKMLQLYKPNKTCEKVISSIQSIEDSINRVVENLRMTENSENEKEEESEGYEVDEGNSEDQKIEPSNIEKVNSSSSEQSTQLNEPLGSCKKLMTGEENVRESNERQNCLIGTTKCENSNNMSSQQKSKNGDLSESESTDSEKLTIAFDNPSEPSCDKSKDDTNIPSASPKQEDYIPTASKDSSYIFVALKDDCKEVKTLIKEFVKVSCWNCVYCSHAKRIALNGKQLALHILAEHRFVTVPESSTEEDKEKSALNIIHQLKTNLHVLEKSYFNTDTFDSENKNLWKMNDRIYECFHCLFATYVHKELCSHNRKMHQKAMFLCIMCKSNFYTYSELLCHLCPGIYVSGQVINPDITYRCFLCDIEPLPSSFRLMVHLRRKHNSCDICFDQSSNQFQLSTHVWKHKLSHMCYRCGIAYRNKPDITKHLFWKHGTESVLCKKCLQKKWPHVYHFCVPPNCFVCDECSLSLKSAVALKVHKRLHSGDYPYPCAKCEEKFISRKLLSKHSEKHEEKKEEIPKSETEVEPREIESEKINSNGKEETLEEIKVTDSEVNCAAEIERKPEKEKKPKKRKVLKDVFDLPPVNLSESDDSDQDELDAVKVCNSETPAEESTPVPNGYLNTVQKEESSPSQIVDGVWNNFQNYLVAKDMPKTFQPPSPFKNMTLSRIKEIMLSDHDYHIIPSSTGQETNKAATEVEKPSENSKKVGLDHDYCNNIQKIKTSCKSKQKTKRKEDASKSSSSDSSSDSDSSCSCGSNCSCSSGSSSSTSSNDSDSDSREKRKQKKIARDTNAKTKVATSEPPAEVDISVHDAPNENLIKESDLETDETETDEDFYDYNPAREANKILAEKRTQLLANLNGSETVMSSPTTGADKSVTPKKKAKFKKKKTQLRLNTSSKSVQKKGGTATAFLNKNRVHQFSDVGVVGDGKLNVSQESTFNQVCNQTNISIQSSGDGDTKRPKRKRVPLKFYGFSSDDDGEATPVSKKREKSEYSATPMPASTMNNSSFDVYGATPTLWSPTSKSTLSWRIEKNETVTPKVNSIKIKASQGSGNSTPTVENSPDSRDQFQIKRPERNFQVNGNPTAHKGEKLYCFCQCPYDEVSEMIACDAEDCLIEWFHFECVGIMVPPKGSWYCPDCRKKLAAENEFMSPPANEQSVN